MPGLDLPSDVLDRCQAGEIDALGQVYDAYGQRVYRLCRSLLGQDADAEDASQEVFLRIHAKASSFGGRSKFSTWIYRLTVNHCLNRRKQRLRLLKTTATLDDRECVGPDATEAVDHREQVDVLLSSLRSEYRAVVVLREIQGLTYKEISEVLEIPLGTVMSRLARARDELVSHISGRDYPSQAGAKS